MNEEVKRLLKNGASIVPIVKDKQSIPGWNAYQTKAASEEQLEAWDKQGYEGYGLMMGYGGYCVIDVDTKNMPEESRGQLFQSIWAGIPANLQHKLCVQRTRNGGEHLLYRCAASASNTMYVKNPETNRKVVETIGRNNYVMVAPSWGYHVVSGSLDAIQEISEEDHILLLKISEEVGNSFFIDPIKTYEPIAEETSTTSMSFANPRATVHVTYTGSFTPISSQAFYNNTPAQQYISASAARLESTGHDITGDYNEWVRIGYAIANAMGENGRVHFHKFSKNYPAYSKHECDKQYDSILISIENGTVKDGITGGTIRYVMKENGADTPQATEAENKTAYKTNEAIQYIRGKQIYRNVFTGRVEKPNGDALTDSDVDTYYIDMRSGGLAIPKGDVGSIINSERIPQHNPLKEWLENAEKVADDRLIDEMMSCFNLATDNPEKQAFYRKLVVKWLLQIPAMIYDGIMPRLVLVLIGGTYIGKSEFFRRLLPKKLNKYYAESALDREKDSEILMTEQLLINIDELAGILKSPALTERFKALSSQSYFSIRVPYGKINERFHRKAILCGTSNKVDVIQDHDTGNSRIIPFELKSIDQEGYNNIDRNKLFGALAKMYNEVGSEYLRLTPEELAMLKSESSDYTTLNIEQELIQKYVRPGNEFKTATEISEYITRHTNLKFSVNKISRELNISEMNFNKTRRENKGGRRHGFLVELGPFLPDDEISLSRLRLKKSMATIFQQQTPKS